MNCPLCSCANDFWPPEWAAAADSVCHKARSVPAEFAAVDMQGWRQFQGHVPEDERADLVAAYHRRLTSADTAVRDAAVSLPASAGDDPALQQ